MTYATLRKGNLQTTKNKFAKDELYKLKIQGYCIKNV